MNAGKGVFGTVFPGCAETFHEAEQESQQGQSRKFRDRHQKIHHFKEGDMIAVPTGIAFWIYNNGENPVVAVSLLYTDSYHNQLDLMPRVSINQTSHLHFKDIHIFWPFCSSLKLYMEQTFLD